MRKIAVLLALSVALPIGGGVAAAVCAPAAAAVTEVRPREPRPVDAFGVRPRDPRPVTSWGVRARVPVPR